MVARERCSGSVTCEDEGKEGAEEAEDGTVGKELTGIEVGDEEGRDGDESVRGVDETSLLAAAVDVRSTETSLQRGQREG